MDWHCATYSLLKINNSFQHCLAARLRSRARALLPLGLRKIFKPGNLPVIYQGWVRAGNLLVIYW